MVQDSAANVMFISHGGGPLPLLGDPGHDEMVNVIEHMRQYRGVPDAIVIVSAHWESGPIAVTASESPSLLYDYYGFAQQAYEIDYSCPGSPALADDIVRRLSEQGITSQKEYTRGLDHGVFVPMALLFPEANIPCVQVSLSASLSPAEHLQLGNALQFLKSQNVLLVGSGFTFHNMPAFFNSSHDRNAKAQSFLDWLLNVSDDKSISQQQREHLLADWERSDNARFNHPREEHLLPYLVCVAAAGKPISLQWRHRILGVPCASVAWRQD